MLPIVAYGHPVLRKKASEIDKGYEGLGELIDEMFKTMYDSVGVGLAAPQINKSIRLVVIDADPYGEEYPEAKGFKKVLINPQMVTEDGDEWLAGEGCLSIPNIHEEVSRKKKIKIRYQDENFDTHEEAFDGIIARIMQHEYDHLEGVLFVDRLPNLMSNVGEFSL